MTNNEWQLWLDSEDNEVNQMTLLSELHKELGANTLVNKEITFSSFYPHFPFGWKDK